MSLLFSLGSAPPCNSRKGFTFWFNRVSYPPFGTVTGWGQVPIFSYQLMVNCWFWGPVVWIPIGSPNMKGIGKLPGWNPGIPKPPGPKPPINHYLVVVSFFFIFTPKIEEMIQFDWYVSNGLKPPTRYFAFSDVNGWLFMVTNLGEFTIPVDPVG